MQRYTCTEENYRFAQNHNKEMVHLRKKSFFYSIQFIRLREGQKLGKAETRSDSVLKFKLFCYIEQILIYFISHLNKRSELDCNAVNLTLTADFVTMRSDTVYGRH